MVYGIVGGVFADHLNIEIQMAYVALYNIFKKDIKETIWSTNYLKCFEIIFLAILFYSIK